ncbi:MAG: hypothetical protein MJA30_35845 [Cytophagales bacterium]|nr:hypothetical protein [Cytophagales bacterium]
MFVSFENMPPESRAWVYQANRKLNPTEEDSIHQLAQEFLGSWAAHGAALRASFKIMHNQFLVILVDENHNMASGCSIDASVHFVQQLEHHLGLNFFDRTKVAFILNDEVFLESLNDLKNKVNEGTIRKNTLTFNNLVRNKQELEEQWLVPAEQTWLGRYFK